MRNTSVSLPQGGGEPLPRAGREGQRPAVAVGGVPDRDTAWVVASLDAAAGVRSAVAGLAPTRIVHAFHVVSPASDSRASVGLFASASARRCSNIWPALLII